MTGAPQDAPKRSLFSLIGDLPRLLTDLVRNEIESLKLEITTKLKNAGIGAGLLVGAALFAFFAFAVLLTAAVLGLATVLPAWASALIVAGVLLLITAILALLGIGKLKRGVPPAPTETIDSIKTDVRVIKGTQDRSKL